MSDISTAITSAAKAVWWVVVIRAVLAILLGIAALIAPLLSVTVATVFFGAYALIDGIVQVSYGISRARDKKPWDWTVVLGALTLIAGLVALIYPLATGLFGVILLLWVIAIWAIVQGMFGLISASKLGAGNPSKGWNFFGGLLTLIFGIILTPFILTTPGSTAQALIVLLGVYAIVFGVFLLVLAFKLRGGVKALREDAENLKDKVQDAVTKD